jgi:hypothetical protein
MKNTLTYRKHSKYLNPNKYFRSILKHLGYNGIPTTHFLISGKVPSKTAYFVEIIPMW